MNYFKTLIISIFTVSCALPAAAQFANSGNNAASSATPRRTVAISPYDRVSVSYVNTKLANDAKGADDISLNGVGLDYIHGFSLSKSFPLYLETGVKATLSFFSREDCEWYNIWNDDADDKDYKTTFQTLSAAIPVNLAYKFTLSNGDVSIVPYLGLNFKLNLMAKGKEVYDPEYGDKDTEKYDMFDKKDMETKMPVSSVSRWDGTSVPDLTTVSFISVSATELTLWNFARKSTPQLSPSTSATTSNHG